MIRDKLIRIGTSIPLLDQVLYRLVEIYSKLNHDQSKCVTESQVTEITELKPTWHIKISAPRNKHLMNWGDYYFAKNLEEAFHKLNTPTKLLLRGDKSKVEFNDIHLVIRGLLPIKPKKGAINVLWVISHPDQVSLRELNKFDFVFVASEEWANAMSVRSGKRIFTLLQATNPNLFQPLNDSTCKSDDFVFVGNSHGRSRKTVTDFLSLGYGLKVYGSGWDSVVPKEMVINKSISDKLVATIYGNARIVLNDHWPDMRINGFISNRIFDALACGTPVISDDVIGLSKVFEYGVFTYRKQQEIVDIISKIEKSLDRQKMASVANDVRINHSFQSRVVTLLETINQIAK